MFNYILFDFDNTIYNYDNAHNKALSMTLDTISSNFKINRKVLEKNYKNEKKIYQKYCYGQASSHNKFIQFKKLFEKYSFDISKLDYYYQLYTETFNSTLKLYPNILEFIKFCESKNIKMYILTNNICRDQLTRLTQLNIIHYFEKIYTSEEFGIEKPDIKLFYYIITDIGCNKDEIVNIGDNYDHDINPLCINNVYSFWFNCKGNENFKITKRYTIFKDYTYLLNFFKDYYIESERFINISNYVGERFDLVQAGGGNTSFKINDLMFIKSSGCCLYNLDINKNYIGVNYIEINKEIENICFKENYNKRYREIQCKRLVYENIIFFKNYRPSIETTLHCLTKKYTVHIHPIQFNCISALDNCDVLLSKLFEEYCLIEYVTPGIDVTHEILKRYNNENIIFLKNHGLVFTFDNIEDLKRSIDVTIQKLEKYLNMNFIKYNIVNDISKELRAISKVRTNTYLSENEFIDKFINADCNFDKVFRPFFPDKVVYCGISYVAIDKHNIKVRTLEYINIFKEIPKIFILKLDKYYLYISSLSINKCREIEEVLESHLICYKDSAVFLDKNEIKYLNNWEAEKHRNTII